MKNKDLKDKILFLVIGFIIGSILIYSIMPKQVSPLQFCDDYNVASVTGSSSGDFIVTYKGIGTGYNVYLSGSVIQCSATADEQDMNCYIEGFVYKICDNGHV